MNIRRSLATVGAAGALAVGSLGVAAPAQAQAPVFTGGLVNVTIVYAVDVNDVVVQVPIAAAVNICDTTVAVLGGGPAGRHGQLHRHRHLERQPRRVSLEPRPLLRSALAPDSTVTERGRFGMRHYGRSRGSPLAHLQHGDGQAGQETRPLSAGVGAGRAAFELLPGSAADRRCSARSCGPGRRAGSSARCSACCLAAAAGDQVAPGPALAGARRRRTCRALRQASPAPAQTPDLLHDPAR